jgi:hypothetical protein
LGGTERGALVDEWRREKDVVSLRGVRRPVEDPLLFSELSGRKSRFGEFSKSKRKKCLDWGRKGGSRRKRR